MKLVLSFIVLATLTGCVYNDAPVHLYMRDYELTRAVNDHFTLGMPAADVKTTLEAFSISYRTFPPYEAEPREIEAAVFKAGPRLSASCCPGSMRFLFDDNQLAQVLFRHPLANDPGLLGPAETIQLNQPNVIEGDNEGSGGDTP